MDFNTTLKKAVDGDLNAFRELYSTVYKQLYYIAYYSLGNEKDAEATVKRAAGLCLSKCGGCKNPETFKAFFVGVLTDCIVANFKAARNNGKKPVLTLDTSTETGRRFSHLTEAERLCASIWAVCGYNTHQISIVTGLKEEMTKQKLESAREKLTENDDSVLYL